MSENEIENEDDFAALFAASEQSSWFENGQAVEGTVVAIGAEVAFISVGAKGEATIELSELKNDEGVLDVAVGDRIHATVMSTSGGLTLSRKLQRGAATAKQLEGAFRSGLPVEGKIEEQVKGGYTVSIARQRAFCPMSQIDTVRDTAPASHLGRVYTFRIIEYREDGHKFVVSRRALLEEEQKARGDEFRKTITVGSVLTGRVVSVRDFGAFVDLGSGVQGLLHVSEMGWSRAATASQVVETGQDITVKVLRVDEGTGQIGLSLKALLADPWSMVSATFEVGQVREGRVTRLVQFGAFVELEAGIEGLAHASTFAATGRSGNWARSVPVGMTGPFEILSIDLEKKRIGVALVDEGAVRARAGAAAASAKASEEAADVSEYLARGNVEPAQSFGGSLADKLRGALKSRD